MNNLSVQGSRCLRISIVSKVLLGIKVSKVDFIISYFNIGL